MGNIIPLVFMMFLLFNGSGGQANADFGAALWGEKGQIEQATEEQPSVDAQEKGQMPKENRAEEQAWEETVQETGEEKKTDENSQEAEEEKKAQENSQEAEEESRKADEEGQQIYEKEVRVPGNVTLSFAGDISFAEGYANMSFYHSTGDNIRACISEDLISRMDQADIMMINNEFTYSRRGQPLSGKTFAFRARPETAENLHILSADIVSLANNHVYDYGETALIDTLDTLDQQGIPHVGAGRNLEEAKEIVYFKAGGMKIAYVSATQVERSYVFTKEATETSAGVLRTFDPAAFLEVIQKAEATSDFVVVYVHWGTEGVSRFEGDQQLLGHQYIDAGADLVIGDHPHCLQGIEYYKGVPILYSLGNYWFNSRTQDTGLAEADISPEGILELRFVPCLQQGCRTVLVTDFGQQQRVWQFLQSISLNAKIDENGVITEKKVEGRNVWN